MIDGFAHVLRATRRLSIQAAGRMVLAIATLTTGMMTATIASAQEGGDPITATHGAWEVRCASEGGCYISQAFNNAEGQPVLLVRIQKVLNEVSAGGSKVEATAQIITPLDVFLPAGLGMKIDSGPVVSAPYVRCRAAGCMSNPPLTGELIEKFKAGGNANFIMVRAPGAAPVEAPISLDGFTAAYGAL